MKVSMHSYLPNAPINLRLNFNFEKLVKHETSLCGFAKVGLKIVQNPLKVCMHGYLSNGYLNSLSNFTYNKVEKIASLRPLLDKP